MIPKKSNANTISMTYKAMLALAPDISLSPRLWPCWPTFSFLKSPCLRVFVHAIHYTQNIFLFLSFPLPPSDFRSNIVSSWKPYQTLIWVKTLLTSQSPRLLY